MTSDFMNLYEAEIVNLMQGDGGYPDNDLTGDGGDMSASNVHEKFQDDLKRYHQHQLPAMGIMAISYEEGDNFKADIGMLIQIVNMGGDLATMDGLVKKIMAKGINILHTQSPYYYDQKKCLLGKADDLFDVSGRMVYGTLGEEVKGPIVVLGQVSFFITVNTK